MLKGVCMEKYFWAKIVVFFICTLLFCTYGCGKKTPDVPNVYTYSFEAAKSYNQSPEWEFVQVLGSTNKQYQYLATQLLNPNTYFKIDGGFTNISMKTDPAFSYIVHTFADKENCCLLVIRRRKLEN